MARYVLKRGDAGARAVDVVAALEGVSVLDAVGDVALLVDATPEALERHRQALRGWVIEPQVAYPLPGGREHQGDEP